MLGSIRRLEELVVKKSASVLVWTNTIGDVAKGVVAVCTLLALCVELFNKSKLT